MMIAFYIFIFIVSGIIHTLFSVGAETKWIADFMTFGLLSVMFAYMIVKDKENKGAKDKENKKEVVKKIKDLDK